MLDSEVTHLTLDFINLDSCEKLTDSMSSIPYLAPFVAGETLINK